MKKIFLILVLLPLSVFANDANPNSYSNSDCENIRDHAKKKDCLILAKKKEAEKNYKNFEDNNRSAYQEDF